MSKKNFFKVLIYGVLAGVAIGLGSLLYTLLSAKNLPLVGSLLFSIGLLLVCLFSLCLYTGKIGFLIQSDNKKIYALELLIGVVGNLIGALSFGYLMRLFFINNEEIMTTISNIASKRLLDLGNGGTPFYTSLIGSVFCGMLVFIAVYGFKQDWPLIVKVFLLTFSVFAFVALGFEHCIANMYYISMANMWNIQTILNVLLVMVGNSIGALLLSLIVHLFKNKN